MLSKKICVIGGGRWGKNHIKTLSNMGCLAAIADSNEMRLHELSEQFNVEGFVDVEAAINKRFDGYIVATPAETHFSIASKLIELGLNVLIEKPMTLSTIHSKELLELAEKSGSRIMVGHLLLFHPAIRKIKELIDSGRIGKLQYIYSTRLNLGTVRTEENVFWSFAPHDISILDYFIGKPAINIEAKCSTFLQKDICDMAIAQLDYPGNIHAHIFTSWLHPFKEQRLVVIGSCGMISFDDSTDKLVKLYNKRIDFENGKPIKVEMPDEIVAYDSKMPLTEELTYFINNLDKEIKVSDGRLGHEVVRILENVQKGMNNKSL